MLDFCLCYQTTSAFLCSSFVHLIQWILDHQESNIVLAQPFTPSLLVQILRSQTPQKGVLQPYVS